MLVSSAISSVAVPSSDRAHGPRPGGAGTRYVLGCDIGGTFTDFVLFDAATGAYRTEKRLTTPSDPSTAVVQGADRLAEGTPAFLTSTRRVVHGSTLTVNALIERTGARTAMIVTAGFRDVLELRWGTRGELWDLTGRLAEPLVPRWLRFEVDERIRSTGEVEVPLHPDQVRRALDACVEAGVTSVAVCLLHAYQNPAHERAIGEIARTHAPSLLVTLSSDVLPQMGEFERFSATSANAYLRPVVERYLPHLEEQLGTRGLKRDGLRLLSSEGSQCSSTVAKALPIRVVESGPVGGVLAAQHFARLAGTGEFLTLDIGGTTAKSCLVADGELPIAEEYEVARAYRFQPGSGIPLNVPSVDILEIGAGGGSIAWIDPLGMLQVGPPSAGADPGPACYANGGQLPTLTDADVTLGLLDPASFTAWGRPAEPDLAREAIRAHVAGALGRGVEESALLIRKVALEKMASAIRLQLAHVGSDPRALTLMAFGGAGPLYAADLARRLGIATVVIPPMAAVFSALGMVIAPAAHTATRSLVAQGSSLDAAELEAAFQGVTAVAERAVRSGSGTDGAPMITTRQAEVRYQGQGRSLRVPAPAACSATSLREMVDMFHAEYRRRFGYAQHDQPVQLTGIRATVTVAAEPGQAAVAPQPVGNRGAPTRHRVALAGTPESFSCAVYDRAALAPDEVVDGPAFIEESGSTTFTGPGTRFAADGFGNLVIRL